MPALPEFNDRHIVPAAAIGFADGTRVAPLRHKAQGHDLRAWLPGCAPGDLAATPLNPRLGPP